MTTERNSARAPRQETPAHATIDLDEVIEHGSTATLLALSAGFLLVMWGGFFLMANVYAATLGAVS